MLFGALNFKGGPGHLAKCTLLAAGKSGRPKPHTKYVCKAMLTTLDVCADGRALAVGNSDGEVYVLDSSLRSLQKFVVRRAEPSNTPTASPTASLPCVCWRAHLDDILTVVCV